jgi:hypothetical protein
MKLCNIAKFIIAKDNVYYAMSTSYLKLTKMDKRINVAI